MGSLNLNLFQLLLRNTFHGSSGQLFLGKAVYSTSWQSSYLRVRPVEGCSGEAAVFRRGKARRPALGTVKLCSGSMVEIWHGAMSCVMLRQWCLVTLRWSAARFAAFSHGSKALQRQRMPSCVKKCQGS